MNLTRTALFFSTLFLLSSFLDSANAAKGLRVLGKGKRGLSAIAVIGGSAVAPIVDTLKASLPNTQGTFYFLFILPVFSIF